MSSSDAAAGDAVRSVHDVNSFGIVLGVISATQVLIAWSHEPGHMAVLAAKAAEEIAEDLTIFASLDAILPDETE